MKRFCAALLLLLLACAGLAWRHLGSGGLAYGADGTTDFIEYWAAFRVLQAGGNPYDASVLRAVEASTGLPGNDAIMMWNPPWTVLMLQPFLLLPFAAAAQAWFVAQVALLALIALVAPEALGRTVRKPLVLAAAAVLFYPVVESLSFGQLGILMGCAVFLFLLCAARGWHGRAALSLVVLTVKPHLFLLLFLPLCAWIVGLKPGERARFLAAGAGGIAALVALCEVLWPGSLWWWLESLRDPIGGPRVDTRMWETPTLSTLVRLLQQRATGSLPSWPLWVVPVVGQAGIALAVARRQHDASLTWSIPALLCLSLIFAPYGWGYDQAVLLTGQLWLVLEALSTGPGRRRIALIASLVSVQGALGVAPLVTTTSQLFFVWHPAAMLAMLLAFRPARPGRERP